MEDVNPSMQTCPETAMTSAVPLQNGFAEAGLAGPAATPDCCIATVRGGSLKAKQQE